MIELIAGYKTLGLWRDPEAEASKLAPPRPGATRAQRSGKLAERKEHRYTPQLRYAIIHEIKLVDRSFTKTDTASAKRWLYMKARQKPSNIRVRPHIYRKVPRPIKISEEELWDELRNRNPIFEEPRKGATFDLPPDQSTNRNQEGWFRR
jgi:hypothetical protein